MKRGVISYDTLLTIAEECRTCHGSEWLDLEQLKERINKAATAIKAASPDNVSDAIAHAMNSGRVTTRTKKELADVFGVCRRTLDNWRSNYRIVFFKWDGAYRVPDIIEQLREFAQK